ncbi:hypothetical protein [Streptococcus cuniculipharyngis]|uniref:DUF2975 domain-containing protein n=1 Tax=Streptococcus cuniculipharyngis TaxID=1562651 RepID=A0A5C5SE97_9STRE|nr:hypothetical protein [Streptococcus cuniculipharyngis]TWS98175.1 hypothetical protein FRX57_04395 [Streptococcus cuniculipharyngis]
MTTATITKIIKLFLTFVANLGILGLGFISVVSLLLLLGQFDLSSVLPAGLDLTVIKAPTLAGPAALVFTLVLANSLMIYGLIKLKAFLASFTETDWVTPRTASFLNKGAILMVLVGLLQSLTDFMASQAPRSLFIDLSVAAWLFLAALLVAYLNRKQAKKLV